MIPLARTPAMLPALLLLATAQVAAQDGVQRFYGYGYDLRTGEYLFTEVHAQRIERGRWLGGTITYHLPDGREFGRKTIDLSSDEMVPVFRLDMVDGYHEGITRVVPQIEMVRREDATRGIQARSHDRPPVVTADAGLHPFIRAHFRTLLAGDTVHFHMAVAGQLDLFRFRARRIDDAQVDQRNAVRILVEPDSWLRFMAGPMILAYDPEERRLLEYRGTTSIHDPLRGAAYDARIAYYSAAPAGAPATLPPLQESAP